MKKQRAVEEKGQPMMMMKRMTVASEDSDYADSSPCNGAAQRLPDSDTSSDDGGAPPVARTEPPVDDGEAEIDEQQVEDYTMIPAEMDRRFGEMDEAGSIRPTIIK